MALTCSLSELARMIERGTIPEWVIEGIDREKTAVIEALNHGQEYSILSPNGLQIITISKSHTRSIISRIIEWFRKW